MIKTVKEAKNRILNQFWILKKLERSTLLMVCQSEEENLYAKAFRLPEVCDALASGHITARLMVNDDGDLKKVKVINIVPIRRINKTSDRREKRFGRSPR